MAQKCSVCGETMRYRIGEHHRDTGKGLVLYRDVRQYTCPNGCRSTFYDFRRAIPADARVRILGFIPAPRREVNVVGPLLAVGLVLFTVLMIAAFLASKLNVAAKAAAVTLLVVFAVWLMNFINAAPPGEERRA